MPLTLIRASRVSPSTEALRRATRRRNSKRSIRSLKPSALSTTVDEARLAVHVARAQVLGEQLLGRRLLALAGASAARACRRACPACRRAAGGACERARRARPAGARRPRGPRACRRSAPPRRRPRPAAASPRRAGSPARARARRAEQHGEHRERQDATKQPHSGDDPSPPWPPTLQAIVQRGAASPLRSGAYRTRRRQPAASARGPSGSGCLIGNDRPRHHPPPPRLPRVHGPGRARGRAAERRRRQLSLVAAPGQPGLGGSARPRSAPRLAARPGAARRRTDPSTRSGSPAPG